MVDLSLCRDYDRDRYLKMRKILEETNTICVEANCPNRYHCFSNGTATFMILGKKCTRNCRYCNVDHGKQENNEDPEKLALIIKRLGLDYVVITSVTRDDLSDGGASVFVQCVSEIKKLNIGVKIELLVPDFQGNEDAIKKVAVLPNILNHNIEVVEELFPEMRPQGDYARSLRLLKTANKSTYTKSGIIVGLGETKEQLVKTMQDLREVNCNFLSIGQYLRPTKRHATVKKYYTKNEFRQLKKKAYGLGFLHVESGPLVRSSYNAKKYLEHANIA